MKLSFIKNSKLPILILTIQSLIFIFIIYLLNGKLLNKVIIFIILTYFIGVGIIIFAEINKSKKIKRLISAFENEPSYKTLDKLLKEAGVDYRNILNDIYIKNKKREEKYQRQRTELYDYKDLIERWAHEIKTPISIIDLLIENHKDEISRYFLESLSYANSSLKDNINRLLYYGRYNVKKIDYKLKELRLKEAINEAMENYYSIINERELVVIDESLDIRLISDYNSLVFIISQVLSNACKYAKSKIKIYNISKMELCIEDDGDGVYQKDLAFIFEKAYTGKKSSNTSSTGMGLYLAKVYANDLGIDLSVKNNEKGKFIISLNFQK